MITVRAYILDISNVTETIISKNDVIFRHN